MRDRLVALAAVLCFFAAAFTADAAPVDHWMNVKVSAKAGKLSLSNSGGTYSVAADTTPYVSTTLGKQAGHWIRVRVRFEAHDAVQVTGLLGENPWPHKLRIQPATDDDSSIGSIKKDGYFVIEGELTAEEEAGGDLYYLVPVTKGGTSFDPHTGFVLAKDARVVRF